jgi:hypothetical protein
MIRVTAYAKALECHEAQEGQNSLPAPSAKSQYHKAETIRIHSIEGKVQGGVSSGYSTTRVKLFTEIIPKYEKRIRGEEYNVQRRAKFPPITSHIDFGFERARPNSAPIGPPLFSSREKGTEGGLKKSRALPRFRYPQKREFTGPWLLSYTFDWTKQLTALQGVLLTS